MKDSSNLSQNDGLAKVLSYDKNQSFPGIPGHYQLKVANWLPSVTVNVFKHSLDARDGWRLRIGGIMINPSRILAKHFWQGPLLKDN